MAWAEGSSTSLTTRAQIALEEALQQERNFVKIHAAEALNALGQREQVRSVFRQETDTEDSRYRIGVWRVMAQTASTPGERQQWISRIEQVALTPDSPDQLLAIESLNKLSQPLKGEVFAAFKKSVVTSPPASQPFLQWAEYLAGNKNALSDIVGALTSSIPSARSRAAYVLRQLQPDGVGIRERLAEAADREAPDSPAYVYLLSSALSLAADPSRTRHWQAELEQSLVKGSESAAYEACHALQKILDKSALKRLEPILESANGDRRVGVACLILAISARAPQRANYN